MSYFSSPPEYYSSYYSPAPAPDDDYSYFPWGGSSYGSSYGSTSSGESAGKIFGIVAGSLAAVLWVCCCICCIWRRRKRRNKAKRDRLYAEAIEHRASNVPPQDNGPTFIAKFALHTPPDPPTEVVSSYSSAPMSDTSCPDRPPPPVPPRMNFGLSQSAFKFEELERATAGFSNENLLGQGGFGYVHKGVLQNGKVVAVKQLKAGSAQGEREFQAEVEVISRVHHRHLVSLVGFCISGDRRLLVYEFVQNKTMEFHLHGRGSPTMSWTIRMKIAQGSAKGLAYLHEDCQPKIIHRDIKSANILIDHDFEAKVADFGLAKFFLDTETHVSTRIMGTFGYLAPEYGASGKLTDKSDVFSFGVVLLELITGRRPIHKNIGSADVSLVEWARPLLRETLETGDFVGLVDPRLQNEYNPIEVKRLIACASACVRHSAPLRPRMSQIIRALEGNIPLDDLNDGVKPGNSSAYGGMPTGDNKTSEYGTDMITFEN